MGTQLNNIEGGRACKLVCRVCSYGAWIFALTSAGIVGTMGVIRLFGADGVSSVFGSIESARGEGLCLAYVDWQGGAQGVAQAMLVLMALTLSLFDHGGLRRLGLFALLLWCAMWLGEAMWHVVDEQFPALVIPVLMLALLMTTYRTIRRWGWRGERVMAGRAGALGRPRGLSM